MRSRVVVAVLYNAATLPPDHPDFASEADVAEVARAIAGALRGRDFHAELVAAAPPIGTLVATLEALRPDVVFNLIEGFGGSSGGEAHVTSLLELLGLPYTGCPPEAMGLCRQKGRAKALLIGAGLPTAPFVVLEAGDPAVVGFGGPFVVKPESEDGSLGIGQGSVVTDPAALADRVAGVRAAYGPRVLVEAYLPGPEYNVGVIALPAPVALPVAEIAFATPPGSWPILTYEAKWAVGSSEDLASRPVCPARIEATLARELGGLAVAAFGATGCRDVARVDFRLDARGEPMILEVNPNPDLGPSAGWARALRVSGRDYAETLAGLAFQAMRRG